MAKRIGRINAKNKRVLWVMIPAGEYEKLVELVKRGGEGKGSPKGGR